MTKRIKTASIWESAISLINYRNAIAMVSIPMVLLAIPAGNAAIEDVYQPPKAFVQESFAGQAPKPSVLWLNKALQQQIKNILGHRYKGLRLRYWRKNHKTVWILEEIGKEMPITVGLTITGDRLRQVKVLVYRESRGHEVRYSFFTDQFENAGLTDQGRLTRTIDGISGATLSVRALRNLARLALFLNRQVGKK